MEGRLFNKVITKLKNKISSKNNTSENLDYVFSTEELKKLEKQNKEKINDLKNNKKIEKRKKEEEKKKKEELSLTLVEEKLFKEKKDITKKSNIESKKDIEEVRVSYIDLSKDQEQIIMKNWKNIDIIKLDELILKGKDILAHNYSISYADDSLAFIYKVRAEYDILVEYLIGFNNEKKGIYNKTIFSDRIDDEWHYLENYIKVLEKIRSAKK